MQNVVLYEVLVELIHNNFKALQKSWKAKWFVKQTSMFLQNENVWLFFNL
jgi:hypothetical protein